MLEEPDGDRRPPFASRVWALTVEMDVLRAVEEEACGEVEGERLRAAYAAALDEWRGLLTRRREGPGPP